MRRRCAAALLTLTTVLASSAVPSAAAQAARADPVYPSKDAVRRARQHAAAVHLQVSRLQAQLTAVAQRAEAADVALSRAAEDFDVAQIELTDRRRAATTAAQVAGQARRKLDAAQQQVGRLAAQSYRTGGPLASLDVLLSPKGPGDVLERASMMHILAGQRQQKVQRMDSARVVATMLDSQAAQALDRQVAAAHQLDQARTQAQHRAAAVHSVLVAEKATRAKLLAQLAAAQQTTVKVERARQAGLQRAAQQRQAAEQRRRATAEAAAQAAARRRAQPPGGAAAPSAGRSRPARSGNSGGTDPGAGSGSGGSSSGSSSAGDRAVSWARSRVGLPYQWGGDGPGSYDCSGLVMRAWQQAGVGLPHSARLQYRQVEKISYAQLRPGDLVFFATDPGNENTIHHVAMYLGGGQMIEAPYTGADVRIVALRTGDSMPSAGRP